MIFELFFLRTGEIGTVTFDISMLRMAGFLYWFSKSLLLAKLFCYKLAVRVVNELEGVGMIPSVANSILSRAFHTSQEKNQSCN